jgi:acetoin utilization deacetylase AcuC-like enzyme
MEQRRVVQRGTLNVKDVVASGAITAATVVASSTVTAAGAVLTGSTEITYGTPPSHHVQVPLTGGSPAGRREPADLDRRQ